MESEIYSRIRADSPEHGFWSVTDDEFAAGSAYVLEKAVARAPYSIYRLARSVARNDDGLEVRYGAIEAGPRALEFAGPDGVARGWIVLNARKEPIIRATTQYLYVFGPLARFGNLYVPDWTTTSDGLVRYAMVSLTGSSERPGIDIFAPPAPNRGS